ncbi:MAG TPA: energy transducer TonB [Puia sp.]|jgi:protein TonB
MKAFLTICSSLCFLSAFSQFKESFYALDSNWKQTTEKKASYLLWIHEDSARNWEYSYYHMWGPLIKLETYRDHQGTQRNGLACYYYTTGNLDSLGHYKDGKKEGKFYKYAFLPQDSLRKTMEYTYANDSLIKTVDHRRDGRDKNDADTAGNKEARFPGGSSQWMQYLQKNLRYPDRAASNEIQGSVRVSFTIDGDGNVLEPIVSKSVEYSLDREALRIIANSGKWEPATRISSPVESDKVQPVIFRLAVSK